MITDTLNQDQTGLSQGPGERLRLARQQLNLSVQDVASRLRLRVSLIEAIERNDYSNRTVPEPVFVCGYIRAYGKLLDLPKEEIEDIIKSFNQLNLPQFKNDRPSIQLDKAGNVRLGLMKGRSIGGFAYLVALVVVVGAVFLWHGSTTQPAVEATEEAQVGPTTAAVSNVETPATPLIDKNSNNSLTQTSEPAVNNANTNSASTPAVQNTQQTVDTSVNNSVPSNVNGNAQQPSGNNAVQGVNSQKNTGLTQQAPNLQNNQNNIQPQVQPQNPTQQAPLPSAAPSQQNPTALPPNEQQLNQSMENGLAKKAPRNSAQERHRHEQQRRANERRQHRLEQQRLRQQERRRQEERMMLERRQQWY